MPKSARRRVPFIEVALWLLGSAFVVPVLSFALLCAWECTAAPWLVFIVAPIGVLVSWIAIGIWLTRGGKHSNES
jgi:hypothetical protein